MDPGAVLDYVTGFSKINNRERFQRDMWEGEPQFDRVYRPSASATAKRIAYLYPEAASEPRLSRYLDEFAKLITTVYRQGARVDVVKMPVPAEFRGKLPGEAAFDVAVGHLLAGQIVPFNDLSAMNHPNFYFDKDHGLAEFFSRYLKPVLLSTPDG